MKVIRINVNSNQRHFYTPIRNFQRIVETCPLTYHSYGSYLSGHEYRQRYCTNVFLSCFMQNVNYEKLMKLRWEMSFSLHSPSTDLPMTLVREQQS